MNPLLSIIGLRKAYGGLKVTDGLDLDVLSGELHAVIGPNGAGKTSLINQISGNVRSDAGSIVMNGVDIASLTAAHRSRLGLARSFQIVSVLRSFSAIENVAMAVQAQAGSSFRFFADASRDEALNRPAFAILAQFGLADRAHARADTLSYGEMRQLELAIALATSPKMLLLDEPLAGTSHDEARHVVETIRALKGRVGILLVEHDMDAVFALADRISVFVAGRVIASGAPDVVRGDPGVRAAYLGAEAA